MKEQLHLIPIKSGLIPIESDLTNQAQNPYPRGGPRFNRGGKNFMAEPGRGEVQPPVGARQPQQGSSLGTAEARRITRENLGRSSVGGGSEDFLQTGNAVLDNIVDQINRVSPSQRDQDFLKRQIHRVERVVDEGRVPADVAREIIEGLEGWKSKAREEAGRREEPGEDSKGYIEALQKLLKNRDVWEELAKETPDFTSPQLAPLREIIEKFKPMDREFVHFADFVARTPEVDGLIVSENSKKILFEWLLERIIGIPDLTPEAHYHAQISSLYIQNNKEALLSIVRSYFGMGDEFTQYLTMLDHVREVAHELNISLKFGEKYKEYVSTELRTEGLDFIQNTLAGVNVVVRLYEKIATQKIAEKKTWFSAGDIQEIDKKVQKIFDQMHTKGLVRKEGRGLTDWEKNRALRLGKIFFAGTQRMAMYAAFGDIPPGSVGTERIGSLPYEYIGRSLVPFKMIAARFFGTDEKYGPRRYLQRVFEEHEKLKERGKFVDEEGNSLFGLDKKTIMVNSYGWKDPESHGWRSQMMFLGNIKIEVNGRITTLLDYLNRALETRGTVIDPVLGGNLEGDEAKKDFSKAMEDIVLSQRLYLSILSRYSNFGGELKTKLWQKIAILKPSTVAALAPQIIGDQRVWDSLKDKLYIAEEVRVAKDYEEYQNALKDGKLREYQDKSRKEDKYELLNCFSEQYGNSLSSEETEFLKQLIDSGYKQAKTLATVEMSFHFAIDDTPVIAWKKTGEGMTGLEAEDLLRLLISDQKNMSDGWAEMSSLVESPTTGAVEHFTKAVNFFSQVQSRKESQDIIDPFITAYLKFGSKFDRFKWNPVAATLARLHRWPTSEAEKYFRNTFFSMDEQEKAHVLQALSVAQAVRDNVVDLKSGLTQFDRMSKETESDRIWLFLRIIRIIMMLLGPVAALEFIKITMPEDIVKALK